MVGGIVTLKPPIIHRTTPPTVSSFNRECYRLGKTSWQSIPCCGSVANGTCAGRSLVRTCFQRGFFGHIKPRGFDSRHPLQAQN